MMRGGRGVTLWNFMLDENGAPNRPGGCQTCFRGGGHLVEGLLLRLDRTQQPVLRPGSLLEGDKPGAVRIATNGTEITDVKYMASKTPTAPTPSWPSTGAATAGN